MPLEYELNRYDIFKAKELKMYPISIQGILIRVYADAQKPNQN